MKRTVAVISLELGEDILSIIRNKTDLILLGVHSAV